MKQIKVTRQFGGYRWILSLKMTKTIYNLAGNGMPKLFKAILTWDMDASQNHYKLGHLPNNLCSSLDAVRNETCCF